MPLLCGIKLITNLTRARITETQKVMTNTNPQFDTQIRNHCANPQWAVIENYGNVGVRSVEWMTEEEDRASDNGTDQPNWGWRWFFASEAEAIAFANEREGNL